MHDNRLAPAMPMRLTRSPDYDLLRSVDWTFADACTRVATHGLHPYPAKFIPQIPRALIEALHPRDGTGIMDPFAGSGTTLVEAALVDIPAIGVDLNPLACLISKVKVTALTGSLSAAAERVLECARNHRDLRPPHIPAVDHWFRRDVQYALSALVAYIETVQDMTLRDALAVALSSIIVRVSNQESDTRYAAVDKHVSREDVWRLFLQAVRSTDRALQQTWGGFLAPPRISVLHRNVLEVEPKEIEIPISLVITSPPYPNAYEYWLYHKYRMYWLGMDPLKVRAQEIGARPHYFKRNPQTAEDFQRQMNQVWSLLRRVLVPRGHVCFQVGNSIIRGELVDNSVIMRRSAEQHHFHLVAKMDREIPNNRKSFNPEHARIREEQVLVFRVEDR